ncbi:hypothetical protein [Pseudobacteriovorax antillogorgiicola]|uniref:Uncharacterized protein n=1 Tax=Pseudobacteriovorax antillogorgiicola TaxID=1513793 RepID=A0A1Y6BY90_9BACT|nr:hypothetical protein [Pseudobacteriovorax antillogorgiicola]TCS53064.1 hypothetical protein EDD56_108115 [Pseudobacteriovorax antillogorgiicola]SMF26309.1 hypothetical protein SAMN06296036_108132 [Pseudobacteriovorax antillogorgiicola]
MLNWNESDLLYLFEQEPFFEDDDQSYEYKVDCSDISLQLKVIPDKSVIAVRILSLRTANCISQQYYVVKGEITLTEDTTTLVASDCIPVGDDEFYSGKINLDSVNIRFRLEISIKPDVLVRNFLC